MVKKLLTVWETWVQSLSQEDPLEKGQYSWASLVAQLVKNPPAVWETWVQSLSWEDPLKKGELSTPAILPNHGYRSLVGYSPWGRKELNMTEQLSFTGFPDGSGVKNLSANVGERS